jgi:hypothetical protein
VILARKDQRLPRKNLGIHQGLKSNLGDHGKEIIETIGTEAHRQVDVARQARLAVNEHRLAPDDHVGDGVLIERSSDPCEKGRGS